MQSEGIQKTAGADEGCAKTDGSPDGFVCGHIVERMQLVEYILPLSLIEIDIWNKKKLLV